jgi:outer membrane receptor protein involved in Fe transport
VLLEGPLETDKGVFLFGGRASYAHLFLALTGNENKAYFYDLNIKLNYTINDNNSVYLSGYLGKDLFAISTNFIADYGNSIANFRWNHLFTDQLFSNLSIIYSDYYYGLEFDVIGFKWDSGISNFNIKYDFKHYLSSQLKLNYGLNNIYYKFNPGEINPSRKNSGIERGKLMNKFANEFSAYIDIEQNLTDRVSLQYGIRWSNFTRLGQDQLNRYEGNNAITFNTGFQLYEEAVPVGFVSYNRSDVMTSFNNLEPRLGFSYLLNESSSLKASYTHMAQYLHLLSNTNSPTPLDVWTPSGPFVKPQLQDQYAIGYFKNYENYSIETEIFFKDIQNRIDYINGANLIANDAVEQIILNGEARAYGLEFLLRKNNGNFTGWIAYTWSRSEQRTPGRTQEESGINGGNWYFTPFDKTHDISLNGSYKLGSKWSFNANFLFQTGQPANYPVGQYKQRGLTIPIYGLRNQERLPAYHRLDVAATFIPSKNANRKKQSEWTFGIYNLYNRMNAASINFRKNTDTGNNEALRTSIFGIVPSVTYNFKF